MSNPGIIMAELRDLHECIEVLCFNIGRISMGATECDMTQQEAKIAEHRLRIAELEEKLVNLK